MERGLAEQVVDQIVEQTRDHAPALADLAARLEPAADELIQAWQGANRDAPGEGVTLPDLQKETVRSWLASLRQRNLRQYGLDTAGWARQLASAGLPYDRAMRLYRDYQRRAVPLVMRVYPAGPELESALDAFDDLFEGCAALIGAAYVEALQNRAVGDTRIQALGQVFAGATHALNNRLAVVLGRMAILIERTHVAEDRAELLDIQEAAADGAQMVRRLQEFARGDRAAEPVAVDVNVLMRDAAEITRFLWRDQAETYGVLIDVVRDFADVPPVLAPPAALREAFVMMIANAVDTLPEGGLVTLRTERQGNRVLASVVAAAPALAASSAHAVDPTAAPTSRTGVGLSAVEKIAADLNAILTVEPAAGRSATCTLSLPLAKGVSEVKEKTQMSTQPGEILLIDNEPAVLDAFTRLLGLYGHHVITAENGEKGLAAFRAGKFDVVFTDLGMPGLSGWGVAREIKKINSKALVVLITGWPIDLNRQKSKETGVDRVISKPLDMPQVLSLIDDAVASRGML